VGVGPPGLCRPRFRTETARNGPEQHRDLRGGIGCCFPDFFRCGLPQESDVPYMSVRMWVLRKIFCWRTSEVRSEISSATRHNSTAIVHLYFHTNIQCPPIFLEVSGNETTHAAIAMVHLYFHTVPSYLFWGFWERNYCNSDGTFVLSYNVLPCFKKTRKFSYSYRSHSKFFLSPLWNTGLKNIGIKKT
jgi:hypothetical protein